MSNRRHFRGEVGVREEGGLKHYRTEVPNIITELGLTPFELALYIHLKKTAGEDGTCFKSTATLANETGMSTGQVSKAKAGLSEEQPLLGGKTLIRIRKDFDRPGRPRDIITIVDVWPENFRSNREKSPFQSSPDEVQSSPDEVQSSPDEPNKEPYKKEPYKKVPVAKATGEGAGAGAREAAPPSESTPSEPFPEKPVPSESVCKHSVESPLALEIRRICKKGIMLSQRDTRELQEVLTGLSMENATPEQAQEFGRKLRFHWIGRDGRTGAPRAPRIIQVLEHWHDVLSLDESAEVLSQLSTSTGGNREHRSITNLRNALIYN